MQVFLLKQRSTACRRRLAHPPLVKNQVRVYHLQKNGEYRIASESAAFPMLPVVELSRFLEKRWSLDETSLVRAFRDWVRERFQVR
jgi:hypothetical protein